MKPIGRRLLAMLLISAYAMLGAPGVARAEGAGLYHVVVGFGLVVAVAGLPGVAALVALGVIANAKAKSEVQPAAVPPQ